MEQSLLTRILLKVLLATAVYAALLVPVGALAGDGEPTVAPTTAATEAAIVAPTTAPTEVPTQAPVETATTAPTQTATSAPAETATGTPAGTTTPAPAATVTVVPSPTASPAPTATATAEPVDKPKKVGDQVFTDPMVACLVEHDARKVRKGSLSREGRACVEQAREELDRRERDQEGHDDTGGAVVPPAYEPDGTPTLSNPSLSMASPGAAPIGVPNFFIDKFRIPPFLLPIYQAAGTEYGIRWEVLAAINEIETDYGRNLNISSAGALGWMQFMPATWRAYGTDANQDGVKDPFNPVDAIFSAARYLKAAGAQTDLRRGIFAYNHADWYVDSVLLRARTIGGLPSNFVGSLTGLTQARFPVQAEARYAGAVDTRKRSRFQPGMNAAMPVESRVGQTSIDVFAKEDAPVIAVNDAKVIGLGETARLGRFIRIRDTFGNTFTYSHLGSVATTYPSPKSRSVSLDAVKRELELPKDDPAPKAAASSTKTKAADRKPRRKPAKRRLAAAPDPAPAPPEPLALAKDRLFANPERPRAAAAGGDLQLAANAYQPGLGDALRLNGRDYEPKRMRKGAHVLAGTTLGRIGKVEQDVAPHLTFEIRPAGKGAPLIDPKPILDGWKLLESTAIYRAQGRNPFVGPDAEQPTIGQILLMSKEALQRQVLENPRITIYECGRNDIRVGAIDRRVLATLAFLASSGLKPTVSSLQCGHGYLTSSGNVSAHSTGAAVDIAAVNGITITPGTQGPGSITETTIQRLLTLQGTMKPQQIISLMTIPDADNTLSMSDHHDHVHVGFSPLYDAGSREAKQLDSVLKPGQWIKLIDRLSEVDNPQVATSPSRFALKVAPTVEGGD